MQNSANTIMDEDENVEWSSFCSSCKSVLQSVCSVGIEPLDDVDELIDQKNVKTQNKKDTSNVENTDAINENPNEYMSVNHIKQKIVEENVTTNCTGNDTVMFEKSNAYENQKINKRSYDKVYVDPSNTHTIFDNTIAQVNCANNNTDCEKIIHTVQNVAHEKFHSAMKSNLEDKITSNALKVKSLPENTKKSKNERLAQKILGHRRNIVEISKSILYFSDYIDDMRKIILQGVHKKKSLETCERNGKNLTSQDFPMYHYNSVCANKHKY